MKQVIFILLVAVALTACGNGKKQMQQRFRLRLLGPPQRLPLLQALIHLWYMSTISMENSAARPV